jgi:hypothetical protein
MLRTDLRRSPVKHVEGELHVNLDSKSFVRIGAATMPGAKIKPVQRLFFIKQKQ